MTSNNPPGRQNSESDAGNPSNLLSSSLIPQPVDQIKVWDDAAIELERTGQATVVLRRRRRPLRPSSESGGTLRPRSDGDEEGDCSCRGYKIDDGKFIVDEAEKIHGRAFQVSRRVFDIVLKNNSNTNEDGCDNVAKEEDEESTSRTSTSKKLLIAPDSDSAHVTGFHNSGSLSSYNTHREGIVLSDGQLMPCTKDEWIDYFVEENVRDNNVDELYDEMELSLQQMSKSLHAIAAHVLRALERRLELPHGWFDDHCFESSCDKHDSKIMSSPLRGQSTTASSLQGIHKSSQWHIKRYTTPKRRKQIYTTTTTTVGKVEKIENAETENKEGERTTAPQILLGMHTDPSLISVVVHDSPGVQMGDAMGLQYYRPRNRKSKPETPSSSSTPKEEEEDEPEWIDCKGHGHAVATIFVGSILAYLTSNQWRGCKHRVVGSVDDHDHDCEQRQSQQGSRMAATLFVRPRQDFLMRPLPSPILLSRMQQQREQQQNQSKKKKPPLTFNAWLKRVARNYEANRRKNKTNQKRLE